MNIGIVVNSAPPFPVAGAERQALEMARRLSGRHKVVVFARRFGGADVVEDVDGYRLIRCPYTDLGPLRAPSQMASFLSLFRKHGRELDVVLSYQTFITGVLAALARDVFKTPFVLWIRSQDEYQYATRRKFAIAGRYVLPRAAAVLVQSDSVRREFLNEARKAFGDRLARRLDQRTFLGPNAVEITADQPARGTELLFVGRLIALKDLSTLFRALRRMKNPPAARIVGDGPMRIAWEAESRGLPVQFTGRIDPAEVGREYRKARAFVLLSLEEGLPNVVLEALAAGVPVVSTPVAAVPDIITDGLNGYLFPFGDDGALAARLEKLFGDDTLQQKLGAGALETARKYSWEQVIPGIEAVLERAASCSAPAGGL